MLYQIENIKKSYQANGECIEVLKGISFSVDYGERVAIVGPSGSGKSTLLNILGAMDCCDDGQLLLEGEDISHWKEKQLTKLRLEKFGFIFQAYHLISSLSVYDNVMVPLLAKGKSDKEKIESICTELGLEERMQHYPHQLSGGEQQRCAIARAIVGNPKILFADEATGNLDEKNSQNIMELLSRLAQEKNMGLIYVTHDLSLLEYADKVIELKR